MDTNDQALIDRDLLLQNITEWLRCAQARLQDVYDKDHREVSFEVGEYVWLRFQPYRQLSLVEPPCHKLLPRFFGAFPIFRRVGPVPYQLKLPDTTKIHDVFHVSLLKPHPGAQPTSTPFLPPVDNGEVILNPATVLRAQLTNGHWEILIQWTDTDPDAATWERVDIFKQVYPAFELEDKLFLHGEADVVDSMAHQVTQRRRQQQLTQ
ncbi:uncharacterized protein [Aristolochia californica]|uniref:uncharacterized protein n=1 Tax=Aristolochia californica TaxID=171875 RepID=UPI0035DAEBF7